jgi:plasmid stability protein
VIAAAPVAEQDRLLRTHGGLVADHMANDLVRRLPRLAARSGLARWQRVAGALAALAVVALVVLAPTLLSILLGGATVTITLGQAFLAVAGIRHQRRRRRRAVPDAELPTYTILVPAYQEQDVVGGMVECLEQLDYPKDRLEALVLVERRDHATRAAVRAANPAGFIPMVDIPPGSPQTKPRSCNAGLLLAKGDLLVVYDAEDRPDRDQLRVVAERFLAGDARLACVQAKLVVSNPRRSFVTRQFAVEYGLRFELLFPGLARLGLPVPLGGTSNHFRTSVLRELGGWDAWNVTEDADLGMRCAALGYRVDLVDCARLPVPGGSHEQRPWFCLHAAGEPRPGGRCRGRRRGAGQSAQDPPGAGSGWRCGPPRERPGCTHVVSGERRGAVPRPAWPWSPAVSMNAIMTTRLCYHSPMRQLIARIDDELHEQLKRRAEDQGRSVNALVTEILRAAISPPDARTRVRDRLERHGLRIVPRTPGRVPSRDAAIASTRGAGRDASAALADERAVR